MKRIPGTIVSSASEAMSDGAMSDGELGAGAMSDGVHLMSDRGFWDRGNV